MKAKKSHSGSHSPTNTSPLMKYGALAVLALLAFVGWSFYTALNPTAPTLSSTLSESSKEILKIKSDDHVRGSAYGKVVLIEYLDFECEACAAYSPLIKQLKDEFKDDLTIVTRYFPLPGHKNSMTAATSVEAAAQQGKFWEMQDKLFADQKQWGEKSEPDMSIFASYAKELGLDMDKYIKDLQDPVTTRRVNRDLESGTLLNIHGTPTFFLNGGQISNIRSYDDFSNLVRAELIKKSQ